MKIRFHRAETGIRVTRLKSVASGTTSPCKKQTRIPWPTARIERYSGALTKPEPASRRIVEPTTINGETSDNRGDANIRLRDAKNSMETPGECLRSDDTPANNG